MINPGTEEGGRRRRGGERETGFSPPSGKFGDGPSVCETARARLKLVGDEICGIARLPDCQCRPRSRGDEM